MADGMPAGRTIHSASDEAAAKIKNAKSHTIHSASDEGATVHHAKGATRDTGQKLNRALGQREADAAFENKTVEMTATSETPEVTREARVVEEVVLSKKAEEHEKTVEATARRTDVKVEHTAANRSRKKR